VSLLPDSKIEHVQKNTVDSPAGKAGSVLVLEFTLAGQRFMALNGRCRQSTASLDVGGSGTKSFRSISSVFSFV
jgi:predicted 3-demethylubiquinone-9 3-methyltransferase (glyoxalase superfamily)